MINAILKGLASFIVQLVQIAFVPIDLAVTNLLPGLSDQINVVSDYFVLLGQYGNFVLSFSGLTHTMIALITALLILNVTIPLAVHGIKLAVRWYRMLMP